MKRIAKYPSRAFLRKLTGKLVVLAVTFATVQTCAAQSESFSNVSFGLDVARDVNDAGFQESWSSSFAANGFIEVPFYYGDIRISGRYLSATAPEITDVRLAHFRLGWGPTVQLAPRLSASLAASAGSLYMSFVDEPVSFRKSESELAAGVRLSATVRITETLSWDMSAERVHAFTSEPLDFFFLSSGLRMTLVSPQWLKDFLE